MKFSVALFASSAMAGIVVRDATIVNGVMDTVGKDIDSLNTAVGAYNGDKTALVAAADQLVSDLKDGQSKVTAGPDLTLDDAVGLASAVNKLAASGSALTTSLTNKKDTVEKAGECKTVQDQIAAITDNSNALIKAVVAKVPTDAQPIAQQLAAKLTTVLEQAESSYKDCTNASGGSSSTGSGSATGSSTASSTGASSTGSATSTAKPTSTGSATTTAGPTGTGGVKPTSTQVTVPTGAAAVYAPAGVLAAVVAALAL